MLRSADAISRSTAVPKRLSLVQQTADILAREINRSTWKEWLPSERLLSESLKISRPTLRKALHVLQANGMIEAVQGTGHRILEPSNGERRPPTEGRVHILCADLSDGLQSGAQTWIDELRNLLFQSNARLSLHHGRQYLAPDPTRALETLTTQHPADCWILARSTRKIQAWFAERGLTCLVAGGNHPGVDLPSITIDMEGVCRDAARRLIDSGHSRLGFIHLKSQRARDVRSTVGFEEAVNGSLGVTGRIAYHHGTTASVCEAVEELIRVEPAPTAILVGTAIGYATVSTFLMQRGFRLPGDFSLISREHEDYLDALIPKPDCYRVDLLRFGRMIHAKVTDLIEGTRRLPDQQFVIPEYKSGDSVARRVVG